MNGLRRVVCALVALACIVLARPARATATDIAFDAGSLIIPMDVDYQNAGTLRAFGLLYQLLHQNVPVAWCILDGKTLYTGSSQFPPSPGNSIDFTASAVDLATNATITNHGYRGGPFVVDASYAAQAVPIITAWNNGQTHKVAVHKATASFVAPVSRELIAAPNIGINNDGNANIAFGYLNAAGIPDSTGNAWTLSSPDVLTPAQVAGPSLTVNDDGALFGPNGYPVYCQFMSMHWTVDRTAVNDAAIAEMAQFLVYPTHLFAECQAVSMIEDDKNGHFVSTDNGTAEPSSAVSCTSSPNGNGLCTMPQPMAVTLMQSSLPFAQFDGPFATVGGSEPAYGWATGVTYFNTGIVMMRASTAGGPGIQDLWMTGFAGSSCTVTTPEPESTSCGVGKVSYLGGHQYSTNVPLTMNPQSQGTRLFLNSLFEADCTTASGQPTIGLTKSAPQQVTSPQVTYTISWSNGGPGIATSAVVSDPLPAGTTFVSASNGGTLSGTTVSWPLNDVGPGTAGTLTLVVDATTAGTYLNQASIAYVVGNNGNQLASNQTSTVYCVPLTMCPSGDVCGAVPDGCGGTVSCGTCGEDETCSGNVCLAVEAGTGSSSGSGSSSSGSGGASDASVESGAGDASAEDAAGPDAVSGSSGSSGGDATVDDGSGSGSGSGSDSGSGGASDAGAQDATTHDGSAPDASSSSGGSGSSSGAGKDGGSDSGGSSASNSGSASSGGSDASGAGTTGDDGGGDASVASATSGQAAGCGCSEPGRDPAGVGGLGVALLAVVAAGARRRRRSSVQVPTACAERGCPASHRARRALRGRSSPGRSA